MSDIHEQAREAIAQVRSWGFTGAIKVGFSSWSHECGLQESAFDMSVHKSRFGGLGASADWGGHGCVNFTGATLQLCIEQVRAFLGEALPSESETYANMERDVLRLRPGRGVQGIIEDVMATDLHVAGRLNSMSNEDSRRLDDKWNAEKDVKCCGGDL